MTLYKKYLKINRVKREIKTIQNLSNTFSKFIAQQNDYTNLMITVTFSNRSAQRITKGMNEKQIYTILKNQYNALMLLIEKLRRSKRMKSKIYYFATFELQNDNNLHMHMLLSIHNSDLIGFIKFIYDYKKKSLNEYQIGRTHIGLSGIHKNTIEKKFMLQEIQDKTYPEKKMYILPTIDSREFISGEATFLEFISAHSLKERYQENIINYIKKTIIGQLDTEVIKIGITKNWNEHNLKTIFNSLKNTKYHKQIQMIRKVGQVYTNTRLPVNFSLYQRYYMLLKKINKKYMSYYNVITDYLNGIIEVRNNKFFYNGKAIQ
jgi:hypothetical protein